MLVIELDKAYCNKEYEGNYKAMINAQDGVIFDEKTVQTGLSYFTPLRTLEEYWEVLKHHISLNRDIYLFYDMEKHEYI